MILRGKELSEEIIASIRPQVARIEKTIGRRPSLAVILVGDDPASRTYVRNKEKACEKADIEHRTLLLPSDTTQVQLLEHIEKLNADPSTDALLVQLPLPSQIDEEAVTVAILPSKDVDGFHPVNMASLYGLRDNAEIASVGCVPCTPRGIMRLLEEAGVNPEGKSAVVVGRSNIVGLPVAKMLLNAGATVTVCHSKTRNLEAFTREADILVCAVGVPALISADMVKEGAVVIDVGINRTPEGKLCGDVDFESVAPKASFITPVPGGVGPMTIASLIQNTLDCCTRRFAAELNNNI